MGGPGSGRHLELLPATRAGVLLLQWAKTQPPKALERVADACRVSPWTVTRWITGTSEPTVRQAATVEQVTGIGLGEWLETAESAYHATKPKKERKR